MADGMKPTWQTKDGSVQLYLGDCLEVLPQLADGSVDAVVTDPPYGIGFKYESHDDAESEYEALIATVVDECNRLVCASGSLWFWQGMRHADRFCRYFPPGFRLFAAAKNFTQHLPTAVQFSWDPVVFWYKQACSRRAICGERDFHVGNTAKYVAGPRNGHPCPRPLDTVEYIVGLAAESSSTILDPFMGSGTTGVACVRTGRKFIGIEIEPKYFEIAVKRIEAELNRAPLFDEPPQIVQRSLLDEPTQEAAPAAE